VTGPGAYSADLFEAFLRQKQRGGVRSKLDKRRRASASERFCISRVPIDKLIFQLHPDAVDC
jgi:hypothetical protein